MKFLQSPDTSFESKNSGLSYGVQRFLNQSILRYQYDVVGWTEFCFNNTEISNKLLPAYSENPLEALRVQDKLGATFSAPPLESIFSTKDSYIWWLGEEYARDRAFYETILENPNTLMVALGLEMNKDEIDETINTEIDCCASDYIEILEQNKFEEKKRIEGITSHNWKEIKNSEYPKVQLGCELGATPEAIVNNFCVYYLNLLRGQFVGSRTAFITSTGPASWEELEACKSEIGYFRNKVFNPYVNNLKLLS